MRELKALFCHGISPLPVVATRKIVRRVSYFYSLFSSVENKLYGNILQHGFCCYLLCLSIAVLLWWNCE